MPMHNPPHPGEVIRTEIIEANGLTVTGAAKILGVSRQALSGLLNANVDLTGDMALRIEKAFGPRMETLMGMQSAFDIFQARKRASKIHVRRYEPALPA
jgi:antitoxin HigA-1